MSKFRVILLFLPQLVFLSLPLRASADFDSLLQCTSNLIYNLKGDGLLLADLAELTQKKLSYSYGDGNAADTAQQCQIYEQQYSNLPSQPKSLYLAQIANLSTTYGIKNLFTGFASPTYGCYSIGGYLGTHWLAIGITGSLDLAVCRSTLGNRWLELRPSGEITLGPGVTVLAGGGNIGQDSDVSYTRFPLSLTPRASMDISAGFALRLASRGQLIPNTIGGGVDIGAKCAGSFGGQLNITALPLGTDYEYLKQRLAKVSHE